MSRFLLPLVLILACPVLALAQWGSGPQALMGNKRADVNLRCPRVYVGVASGLNAPTGLIGANADVAITQQVSVCAGLGRGTWGWKASLEGRYYFSPCNRGLALALGTAFAAGGLELIVDDDQSPGGKRRFFQRPTSLANLSAMYFIGLGDRGSRAYLQAGYALPLNSDPLETEGGSSVAVPRGIELHAPGGPMIAVGVSLGIGNF